MMHEVSRTQWTLRGEVVFGAPLGAVGQHWQGLLKTKSMAEKNGGPMLEERRDQSKKKNFPGTCQDQGTELSTEKKTRKVTLEVTMIVPGQDKNKSAVTPGGVCTPRLSHHCQAFIESAVYMCCVCCAILQRQLRFFV